MDWRGLGIAVLLAPVLGACADPDTDTDDEGITIRWTEHGVPHIVAPDLEGAGFGQGYAFAKLNACILYDQIIKVRGERAITFGPGEDEANVKSDILHRFLDYRGRGETFWAQQPERVQALVRGYAAGFNASVEAHRDELPCGDEPWAEPISEADLFAHYAELGTVAAARQLFDFMWAAQPPTADLLPEDEPTRTLQERLASIPGSNGWAVGRDKSEGGRGMTVANPHFPWNGELRLFESHLTVPGELDVYGVSLLGVPGTVIGFNEAVSWTHTFSRGNRFTLSILELDPADPTRYLLDGESIAMEAQTITIDVLEEDGSVGARSRLMWRDDEGPIVAIPEFGGWSDTRVFALRDANHDNHRMVEQFLAMASANDLASFQDAFHTVQGIPWVHTIAADTEGTTWYADGSATPNLSDDALEAWNASTDPAVRLLKAFGAAAVPGDDSMFRWVEEPGAREPGLVPFADAPQLARTDFVFNSNDSHWLSNPADPLEGFSGLYGAERGLLRPRTQMNALVLSESGPGTPAGEDGRFSRDELKTAILSNEGITERKLRGQVVDRCRGTAAVEVEDASVELAPLCDALEAWDGRADLDSRGALLWRELLGSFDFELIKTIGPLYANAFDPDDPLHTPEGLAEAGSDEDDVLLALAEASLRLEAAGLTPTSSIGEAQYMIVGDERVPMHGASRHEGVANLMVYDVFNSTLAGEPAPGATVNAATHLSEDGYLINYGSAFLLAVEFTDAGPVAEAMVAYGQSSHADSEHFTDQLDLLTQKQWRPVAFTAQDVEQATLSLTSLEPDP